MHIILFNTKGGVSKSTLCEYISIELNRLKYSVSVGNTDQQKHVSIIDNDNADFYLYDTAGAFTADNMELMNAATGIDDVLILVPMNTGINDFKELDFLIEKLEECKVKHKSKFLFTKARHNSKALSEKRDLLRSKGLIVCNYVMPQLEDFSEQRHTPRTRNEISKLIHEVIL